MHNFFTRVPEKSRSHPFGSSQKSAISSRSGKTHRIFMEDNMPGKREIAVNPSSRLPEVLHEKPQANPVSGWYEENREAIEALNKFAEENGSFSDFHRTF